MPAGDRARTGSQSRKAPRFTSFLQWPVGFSAEQPGPRVTVRERTIRWAAVAGLIWRTMLIVTMLPLTISWSAQLPEVLAVALLAAGANIGLLVIVGPRNRPTLLRQRSFFVADIGVAAGLNLWTSAVIERGSLYAHYPWRDLFFPYVWGTIALWTGVRGVGTGVALVLLAAGPLQWGMTAINHSRFAADFAPVLDRDLWLVATFALALGATYMSRRMAEAVALVGEETARAELLRTMHDSALQTLEGIALQADASTPAEQRLPLIRDIACQQALRLRSLLRQNGEAHIDAPGLRAGLRRLVEEFRHEGLAVELVTHELVTEPSAPFAHALVAAAHEAFTNVIKHAGTNQAVVRAATRPDGVSVTIRDHGKGFALDSSPAGFGLTRSVAERMQEVGGTAEVWSEPGRGTRVTLWTPQ
jgi:signal transduction histidine kinase